MSTVSFSRRSFVVLIVWVASFTPWIIKCGANQDSDSSGSEDPPGYIHRCYKDDPDFSACIVKTMNSIKERMVLGIPEMGVPQIEPLSLGDVDHPVDVAGFRVNVKDVFTTGASNITVVSAKGSLETGKYEFVAKLDRAVVSGDYELSSAVPFFQFSVDGKVTGTITDITFLVDCQTEIVKRNDVDFLHIVSLDLSLIMGDMAGSLWIGDQKLHLINNLVNLPLNLLIINRALTSTLQPTFSSVVLKYSNRMLDAFPYDTLIPNTRPVPQMYVANGLV